MSGGEIVKFAVEGSQEKLISCLQAGGAGVTNYPIVGVVIARERSSAVELQLLLLLLPLLRLI